MSEQPCWRCGGNGYLSGWVVCEQCRQGLFQPHLPQPDPACNTPISPEKSTDERAQRVVGEVLGRDPATVDPTSAKKLIALAFDADKLHDLTDCELAALLLQKVYNKLNTLSVQSSIVSQAIDRLIRANGGSYPRPSDEEED